MKKILISIFFLFSLSANAMEKETTFKKELFDKAQSDGKIVSNQFLDKILFIMCWSNENSSECKKKR